MKTAVIPAHIKEAERAANVPQLHLHAMRNFCATKLMKAGLDMRKIQIHLGHRSIESTQRYTHMMSSEVQGEVYEIYSRVREPDFFRIVEEIVYD